MIKSDKIHRSGFFIKLSTGLLFLLLCFSTLCLHAEESFPKGQMESSIGIEGEDNEKILIFLDGILQEYDGTAFISEGRTMVPVRFISESLGADVKWLKDERVVFVSKNDKVLYIPIDNNKYIDNGADVDIDAPALIVDSRTYVPIKFISEALNVDLDWQELENNKNAVFLFSKNQNSYEKEGIKLRALKELDLTKRNYRTEEIDAINLLNLMPNTRDYTNAITSPSKNSFGIKYDVDDLIDSSINFLYACTNMKEEDLDLFLKTETDQLSKEELFSDYNGQVAHFLTGEKIVFKDKEKVSADKDYFRVYLSALNLTSKQEYLICFSYGQSQLDENKIKIQNIDISSQNFSSFQEKDYLKGINKRKSESEKILKAKHRNNEKNREKRKDETFELERQDGELEKEKGDKGSTGEEKEDLKKDKNKSKTKDNTKKQQYKIIEDTRKKLWQVDDSENITRTSFYIQKLRNGVYEKEIRSLHVEDDNWLDSKSADKYKELPNALVSQIMRNSRMSEEELSDCYNSGFKINVYLEMKVVDPHDGNSKWCRLMEDENEAGSYREAFLNKDASAISDLTRRVMRNFSSYYERASKSFEFKAKGKQKKVINLRFLELGSEKEIAASQTLRMLSDEKTYEYKAPKTIDGLYTLVGDEDLILNFDLQKKEEVQTVSLYYIPVNISENDAAMVLDEWRLSKRFHSLLGTRKAKEPMLKIISPVYADDKSVNLTGFLSPMRESDFYIRSVEDNEYLKIDYKGDFKIEPSLNYSELYHRADAPVLIKRPFMNANNLPSYNEAMSTVKFTLDTDSRHRYLPIKKIYGSVRADKTRPYSFELGEALPVQYEKKDAYYNIALKYLSHQTQARQAPKFSSYEYSDAATGIFGMNYSSGDQLNVVPKVMMIYDNENGQTDAKFVNANQYRTIHPISNHSSSFNLAKQIAVKQNVSSPGKALSLAKAMGFPMPVVDKGAKAELTYSANNVLKVKSYTLDLDGKESNAAKNHNFYLQSLGMNNNQISGKLKAYLSVDPNSVDVQTVFLHRNGNEKTKKYRLQVRSGRIVSVDGIPYSNLNWNLRSALDNMKLTGVGNNTVLAAFARGEGEIVNEQIFSDLSVKYRHIPHPLGTGWYNEDSDGLILTETESNFDLLPSKLNIKTPLNVKGLETPINDRLKYSRGIKVDLNVQLFLDSKAQNISSVFIPKVFILPNAEK